MAQAMTTAIISTVEWSRMSDWKAYCLESYREWFGLSKQYPDSKRIAWHTEIALQGLGLAHGFVTIEEYKMVTEHYNTLIKIESDRMQAEYDEMKAKWGLN